MISNPKYGWCDFELGDFHGHPSYLTNVPVDLLEAFINYFKNGTGLCFFDEEGSEFTLILKSRTILIMEENETLKFHDFSDLDTVSLAEELVADVIKNLYVWCNEFDLDIGYRRTIEESVMNLDDLVKELESYISKNKENYQKKC